MTDKFARRLYETGLEREPLSIITLDTVRAEAIRLVGVDRIDPDTIDLPDLLTALTEVSANRPTDGDGHIVLALVKLAALALLWSESADGLVALVDHPDLAADDPEIEALLATMDERRSGRPALGER